MLTAARRIRKQGPKLVSRSFGRGALWHRSCSSSSDLRRLWSCWLRYVSSTLSLLVPCCRAGVYHQHHHDCNCCYYNFLFAMAATPRTLPAPTTAATTSVVPPRSGCSAGRRPSEQTSKAAPTAENPRSGRFHTNVPYSRSHCTFGFLEAAEALLCLQQFLHAEPSDSPQSMRSC